MTARDVHGELTFDPVPEGTRLHWSWDVEEHGILKLIGPAATFIGRRQERAIWSSLKWQSERAIGGNGDSVGSRFSPRSHQ